MSIVLFAPYGSNNDEGWFLYLLATYLGGSRSGLMQLVCNGCFPVCMRDRAVNWKRSLASCASCAAEQRLFGGNALLDSYSLSQLIDSQEVIKAQRVVDGMSRENLLEANYEGLPLFLLALPTFQERFARDEPSFVNKQHEVMIRQLYISIITTYCAGQRLSEVDDLEMVLTAGPRDFMIDVLYAALREAMIPRLHIRYDEERRCILASREHEGSTFDFPFVVDAISLLYQTPSQWPVDIRNALERFVDLAELRSADRLRVKRG